MRYLLAAAIALAGSSAALAADLPPVFKALPLPVAVTSPWPGFYFGALAAGAKTSGQFDFVAIPGTGNIHPTGYMAGAQVGYGTWNGSLFLGVEADGSYDFSKTHNSCVIVLDCSIKSSWLMTQRVVVGMTASGISGAIPVPASTAKSQWPIPLKVPTTAWASALMPYLTAGLAERRTQACVTLDGCSRQWIMGPAVGGGVRLPASANFSLGVEYLYVNYNKSFVPAGGPAIFPAMFKANSEHIARVIGTYHM